MPSNDLPEWVRQHRWAFGRRLREARQSCDLTQEQLAELVGIDRKTIIRAENGHTNIGIDLVARLAHALDVPSWQLFKYD